MNDAQVRSHLELILTDTLLCSARILNTVEMTKPEVLAAFDRIDEVARQGQIDCLSAAERCGEPVTGEILAILVSSLLVNWIDGGARQMIHARGRLMAPDS